VVTSVSVFDPVEVAKTLPLRKPTRRTLSFCGAIAIVVSTWLTGVAGGTASVASGRWLTAVSVSPFAERYKRSVP
jgi:hypothetical protein